MEVLRLQASTICNLNLFALHHWHSLQLYYRDRANWYLQYNFMFRLQSIYCYNRLLWFNFCSIRFNKKKISVFIFHLKDHEHATFDDILGECGMCCCFQILAFKWKLLWQCKCGKDKGWVSFSLLESRDDSLFLYVCVSWGTANLCVSPLQLSGKSVTSLPLSLTVTQRR